MKTKLLSLLITLALLLPGFLPIPVRADPIQDAIDAGVAWLASEQNPDGYWGTPSTYPERDYRLGTTALAVLKLEDYAFEQGKSPLDPNYQYHTNVVNGLKYIFSKAHKVQISPQNAGNPDKHKDHSGGWGYGISFSPIPNELETYEAGVCMMAIAASRCPDKVVGVAPDITLVSEVKGWTYKEVLCEAVDYLAYGQCDTGNARGGWRYSPNNPTFADNSCTGYAVIGLQYAENSLYGFCCEIPDFVRTELGTYWIPHIQATNDPSTQPEYTCKGGAGYASGSELPRVSTLLTGNLLCEMAFVGLDVTDGRVDNALHYIGKHWNEPNVHPGWKGNATEVTYYQSAYCLMRGLQSIGASTIKVNGNPLDWYQDMAQVIADQPEKDASNPNYGSWPQSYTAVEPTSGVLNKYPDTDGILSTVWALLTLERSAPPPPCECEGWNPVTASWTEANGNPGTWTGNCGGTVTIASLNSQNPDVTVSTTPKCSTGCAASENWTVTSLPGPIAHGDGTTANFPATSGGNYTVTFNATCGRGTSSCPSQCGGVSDNVSCEPCTITVTVGQKEPTEPVLHACASPCVNEGEPIKLMGWLEPPSDTATYEWKSPTGYNYTWPVQPLSVVPAKPSDSGVWTLTVKDGDWTGTANVNVKVPCDNCTCEGWNPVTVSWPSASGINTLTGSCGQQTGLTIKNICCDTTVKVSSSENCSCPQGQLFDVYLLADTTCSMKNAIDKLKNKNNAHILVNALAFCNPNIALGVGYYQDFESQYTACFTNLLSPLAYHYPVEAKLKIGQWPDGACGDPAEGQLYALYKLATATNFWRPGAKRIIVWFGDNPGHDPICDSFPGVPPGGITEEMVIKALYPPGCSDLEGITVLAINMTTGFDPNFGLDGDPLAIFYGKTLSYSYDSECTQIGTAGQATRITTGTKGKYLPGATTDQIVQTIIDMVKGYTANFVTQVPATYEFEPSDVGVYPVTLTASCDNITCPPCNIDVLVRNCTKPEASIEVVASSSLCPQLFTLTGKPDNMMSYIWTDLTKNEVVGDDQHLDINATNWTEGDYLYTLTVTDANGCSDNETVTVQVVGFADCPPECDCQPREIIIMGCPPRATCIPDLCGCADLTQYIPFWYWKKVCYPKTSPSAPACSKGCKCVSTAEEQQLGLDPSDRCNPPDCMFSPSEQGHCYCANPPAINSFTVGPAPSFGGPCVPGAPWNLSWDVDVPYTQIAWPASGNATHPVYIELKCTDSNNIEQTYWGPEAFQTNGNISYTLPADFQPCDRKCEFCLWTYDCNLKKVMKCEPMCDNVTIVLPCPAGCICVSPYWTDVVGKPKCAPCPCEYAGPNMPKYCYGTKIDASLSIDPPCACLYPGSTEFNVNLTGTVSGATSWTLTASSGGSSTVIASAQNLDSSLTYPINKDYSGNNLGPNLVPITFTLTANGPGGSDTATVTWEFCPHQLTIASFTGGVYTGTALVAPALACKQGTNWTLAWHLTSINAPVGWEPSVSIAIRCPDFPNTPDVPVGTFSGLDGGASFKLPKDYCGSGCYFLLHTHDCAGNDVEQKVSFWGGEGSKLPPTACSENCDCLTEKEALDLGYTTLCQQEPCSAAGEPQKFCYSRCPEGCYCVTEKEADEQGYTISCSDEKCDPKSKEAKYCFSPPVQPCSQKCQCLTQAQAKEYGFRDGQRCQAVPCKQDAQGRDMFCYPKPKTPLVDVTADRSFVTQGDTVRVCWKVAGEGITEVLFSAAGEKPAPVDPQGCKTFRPTQQTRYLVTARNAAGSGQDSVTVGVGKPPEEICPTITSFTANCPTTPPAGTYVVPPKGQEQWAAQPCPTCCTVSWSVTGPAGTTVSISGIGNVGMSGSTQAQSGASYTLTARYGNCVRTATVQVPR